MPDSTVSAVGPILLRSAEFTTLEKDEVLIRWVDEKGAKQIAFYNWQQYKRKQTEHGKELYPAPGKFKW